MLNKKIKLLSLLTIITLIFSGCYKLHHNYMIKGKWYINAVEIDGGSTNFIEEFLDNYKDGEGEYITYMLDNGLVRGEYYTYDTLNYFITGEWSLLEHDEIYLKADKYIDGIFKVEVVDSKNMILSTESNNINFYNIGEVKSVIRISRDAKGRQSDTTP